MSEHHEKVDLKGISQKIYRHEYIDGFTFILAGFMLFLTAGVINLHPVFMSLIIGSFIAFLAINRALRSRFTYPRLGYFKAKTEDPKKLVSGILLFTGGIMIVFFILLILFTGGDPRVLYDYENWYRFLPIVFGLIMFGPSLDLVDKTGQRIYYSIGMVSTILGLSIVWMNFQNAKFGFTFYLLLLGSISFIIGIYTFVKFMKKYPIIDDSEHLDIQEDNDDF
ncbi:MAG: hypothetical protein ACXAC8_02290 [Candidatus Hodarchaeales archaeon]|jgi:NO-binding membrane sensor protein with MHYT domain